MRATRATGAQRRKERPSRTPSLRISAASAVHFVLSIAGFSEARSHFAAESPEFLHQQKFALANRHPFSNNQGQTPDWVWAPRFGPAAWSLGPRNSSHRSRITPMQLSSPIRWRSISIIAACGVALLASRGRADDEASALGKKIYKENCA